MATKQKPIQNRDERIDTRLPAAAKQTIEQACQLQGRSITDFVTAAALSEATRIIKENTMLQLSLKDSLALAEAFLNPPPPNTTAIAAARRHKQRLHAS